MVEQSAWFAGKPEYESFGLSLASDTEAYAGHLRRARELTQRATDSAVRADSKEAGAIWQENAALREAVFGNATKARQAAGEALKMKPTSQAVEIEAALALSLAGDGARAESLAQDLGRRFPLDTPDTVHLAADDSGAVDAGQEESGWGPQPPTSGFVH